MDRRQSREHGQGTGLGGRAFDAKKDAKRKKILMRGDTVDAKNDAKYADKIVLGFA